MLQKLVDKLSTEMFQILAENRLGMDVSEVNTCLQNKRTMTDLLKKWRASQPDMKVAYTNLYHVLLKANMRDLTGVLVGKTKYFNQLKYADNRFLIIA